MASITAGRVTRSGYERIVGAGIKNLLIVYEECLRASEGIRFKKRDNLDHNLDNNLDNNVRHFSQSFTPSK